MTHDPYTNRDPLDPVNPREAGYSELDGARNSSGWGWILGGLAALVLLFVFVFGFGGGERTASNTPTPPAATGTAPQENTGAAPRTTTPAAPAPTDAKPAQ